MKGAIKPGARVAPSEEWLRLPHRRTCRVIADSVGTVRKTYRNGRSALVKWDHLVCPQRFWIGFLDALPVDDPDQSTRPRRAP